MIESILEWGPPRDFATALEQADAAASMGATWSKWQMLTPDRLASRDASRYWSPHLGGSESQLETFNAAGNLSEQEWGILAEECKALDVGMLVTPFDLESVDVLENIGVEAFKISSGDITYRALYERIARTGKRVFFSTGAASQAEIRSARAWLKQVPAVAMACDLIYPCRGLDSDLFHQIDQLKGLTSVIGYSDHTLEVVTGAVAVACGVHVLEKHVTLDSKGGSPDDRMALTVEEADDYLCLAQDAERLSMPPKDNDPQSKARIGARRSAYATRDLNAGKILAEDDIAWLRPCPPESLTPIHKLVGRALISSVEKGQPIQRDVLA